MEILSDTSDVDAPFISDEDTDVQKNFGNENRKSKHSEEGMVCIFADISFIPLQAYVHTLLIKKWRSMQACH